jgi:hypothetical protein
MVELLHRERTIKVKIVYYGPPVGGKTTNLQVLHRSAGAARRGEMISINSAQDRTILFDLLPLRSTGFRGFDLRLQVLAVPGQAMYAATRRLVLKGADSIVFVANSAADRWEENIQSFREMTQNLLAHQLDPAALPLVLQFNKRDLPEVTPFDFMERALNARKVDVFPAVAVRGEGVLETFAAILLRTVQDLSARYQIVETARGQSLTQWTEHTVRGMFGATTLALDPAAVVAEPTLRAPGETPPPTGDTVERPPRRMVRVALPEEAARPAGAAVEARTGDAALADTYAQASQQLGTALGDLREERDQARQRHADLLAALASAQDALAGQPLEPLLQGLIGRMLDSARATCASFLVPDAERGLRAAALRELSEDPLLRQPAGARLLASRFMTDSDARLHQSADSLDLGDLLEQATTPLGAVVSVPVRSPRGLQGLALLYYAPDAALPRVDDVAHLASMARAVAAPLELAQALADARDARESLLLALAGSAARHGLDDLLARLLTLRDHLGALRRRADAPSWLLEQSALAAPLLAGALAAARSLLSFMRGALEHEPLRLVELTEDLTPPVVLSAAAGAELVSGDAALLRVALRALIEAVQGADVRGESPAPLRLRASLDAGRVRLDVPESPVRPGLPRAASNGGVALTRRIAEMHGGSLHVERDAQGATRFSLYLSPAS